MREALNYRSNGYYCIWEVIWIVVKTSLGFLLAYFLISIVVLPGVKILTGLPDFQVSIYVLMYS